MSKVEGRENHYLYRRDSISLAEKAGTEIVKG
jgi:hypothetical protein